MSVGGTTWTSKQVGTACGICPAAASRKIGEFMERVRLVGRGLRALEPDARTCDLAESVLAMMDTGGRLAGLDRDELLRCVREAIEK